MIFHEIYGNYYRITAAALREAISGNLTRDRLNALIRENAFGESFLSVPEGLTGEKWRVLHSDLSSAMENPPRMPLTLLEKRWLKTLLLDPRIQLFDPDPSGLEEVAPLFTPDMIVYYDRSLAGDPWQDAGYSERFRIILDALRKKKALRIFFLNRNRDPRRLTLMPERLEYLEKDDCFRLQANGLSRRWTIRLSRIVACEISEEVLTCNPPAAEKRELTFELVDQRNALQRAMLHFSHLEKETKRIDETRYQVVLKYDAEDETEMLIRILSFGPAIRVTAPEDFLELIRDRLEMQSELIVPAERQKE